MVYGIDLGTTNSLIGVGDKLLSGMVPSIVDLKTRKAGESERYNWDTERGFKVNMDEGISGAGPRLCSSYVLTELKRQANLTGVIKAVISVPAYFNATQRQATMDAALMADIEVVKLINEPTAAALYITKQKPGVNIVFDLGGGTFDISVIETDGHKYRVLATDGRILGGNDFDRNLLDYLGNKCGLNWRTADEKYLSTVCDAKIRMQKERRAFTVQFDDLTTDLSPEEYMSVMKATFIPAITLARNVMKDAGIEDATFNFVGGSTRCPYLREWVIKELNIQHLSAVDYNPDLVVAQGACMFADLYSAGTIDDIIDVSKFIGFAYNNPGNCILNTLVPMNMPVPCVQKTSYIVGSALPIDECTLYFYQGLSCLSSECTRIGTMKFKFSELQKPGSAVINIDTAIDTNGCIHISCFEALEKPQVFIGGLNEDT